MKDLLLIMFSLWSFLHISGGVPSLSSHLANPRTTLPLVKPQIIPIYNQQNSIKPEAVSITISSNSSILNSGGAAIVKVRIENTTKVGLPLGEPSDFRLAKLEVDAGETEHSAYSASAQLWECSPKSTVFDQSGMLPPGETFECEIDLSRLNWKLSKSSTYNMNPIFPAGYLFYEVPSGTYNLFFGLYSPQEVIGDYPISTIYRSNEIHVELRK